jgi:hypothetical protein
MKKLIKKNVKKSTVQVYKACAKCVCGSGVSKSSNSKSLKDNT